jgi:hypothetical protein
MTETGEQLKQAERSFDMATRGQAWKSIEVFGVEISRSRKLSSDISPALVLGTSADQAPFLCARQVWFEWVALRAFLPGFSCTRKLRAARVFRKCQKDQMRFHVLLHKFGIL